MNSAILQGSNSIHWNWFSFENMGIIITQEEHNILNFN